MPPREIEKTELDWKDILDRNRIEFLETKRQLMGKTDTGSDNYWIPSNSKEQLDRSIGLNSRSQALSSCRRDELRQREVALRALRRMEEEQERERRQLEIERDRLLREREIRQYQESQQAMNRFREQELDMMEKKLQEYQQVVEDWGHVYDQWGADWHKERQSQQKERVNQKIEEIKRTIAKFDRNVNKPVPSPSKRMPGPPPDPIIRKQSTDRKIFILDEE